MGENPGEWTLQDVHWFILLLRSPLPCIPDSCDGRTSCCRELARPNAEPAAPVVIPAGPGPAPVTALASKEGALMPAAIAAAAVAASRELRPTSDWDWDSVSSMLEPAAVLPLAFLLSCSRGSSWQR